MIKSNSVLPKSIDINTIFRILDIEGHRIKLIKMDYCLIGYNFIKTFLVIKIGFYVHLQSYVLETKTNLIFYYLITYGLENIYTPQVIICFYG